MDGFGNMLFYDGVAYSGVPCDLIAECALPFMLTLVCLPSCLYLWIWFFFFFRIIYLIEDSIEYNCDLSDCFLHWSKSSWVLIPILKNLPCKLHCCLGIILKGMSLPVTRACGVKVAPANHSWPSSPCGSSPRIWNLSSPFADDRACCVTLAVFRLCRDIVIINLGTAVGGNLTGQSFLDQIAESLSLLLGKMWVFWDRSPLSGALLGATVKASQVGEAAHITRTTEVWTWTVSEMKNSLALAFCHVMWWKMCSSFKVRPCRTECNLVSIPNCLMPDPQAAKEDGTCRWTPCGLCCCISVLKVVSESVFTVETSSSLCRMLLCVSVTTGSVGW